MNLAKYTGEELLLIYKNQSIMATGQPAAMAFSSESYYDEYDNYYNYDNYDNYNQYDNYNNYYNYNQYSDSGCFITSAVCKTFGKPDDCRELMAFRAFRDTYMKGDETLNGEVNNYYEIAPKICDAIDAKGEAAAKIEYEWIWSTYLSKAYDALNNEEPVKAYQIYKNMVIKLQEIYLK